MFRQAVRSLLKSPAYSAIALATLAIGIGANAAIFSIVDGVLLKPLAYRDPDRLVLIREIFPPLAHLYPKLPANLNHFFEWRREARSFDGIAAARMDGFNLASPGEPELLPVAFVSWNYFSVLGVEPRLGRSFTAEEEQPSHNNSVVITDSLWRRRFGANPSVIGQSVMLNGQSYSIVGVLPSEFRYPQIGHLTDIKTAKPPELFSPLTSKFAYGWGGDFDYSVAGRLKRGITASQALTELNVLQQNIVDSHAKGLKGLTATIDSATEQVIGSARTGLILLQSAVGAVLLIVCLNLANLTMVRMLARSRDLAVRAALGANRKQLIWSILSETLILGIVGGIVGTALAFWIIRLIQIAAPFGIARLDEVIVDWRVLLFAALTSIAASLFVGLLPAWKLTRGSLIDSLQAASAKLTEGRGSKRLRNALISAEVAVSIVLLAIAGLLTGSLVNLLNVDKGFQTERVLGIELGLPGKKYPKIEDRVRFSDRIIDATKRLPSIQAVGTTTILPLTGESSVNGIRAADLAKGPEAPIANFRFVTPGLFRALGLDLKQGRFMEESDRGRWVAVISESVARKVWPNQNPIGKKLGEANDGSPEAEVIGVVGEVKASSLSKDSPLTVYLPLNYRMHSGFALVVRSTQDPKLLVNAIRSEVSSIDPELPLARVRTLAEIVDESVSGRRFQMNIIIAFALASLLLASLGIYGVVSYSVAQRTNEIGLRMALGAKPRDLLSMILQQGLRPVVLGLLVGLALALIAGRFVQSLLFGISPAEPRILIGTCLSLLVLALAACLIPAQRAAKLDPLTALRHE